MATMSDALAEAYALAPSDDVVLHTLELLHPSFVDDDGNPTAIRLVRDHADLVARLEVDAPMNPAERVPFTAVAFDLTLPDRRDGGVPELQITLDGVSRDIIAHLEAAQPVIDPITVIYRPYLSSDLDIPQMLPPLSLTLASVSVTMMRVTGRATANDLVNLSFPRRIYRPDDFPGLVR